MNKLDWERLEPLYASLLEPMDNATGLQAVQDCCDAGRYLPDVTDIKDHYRKLVNQANQDAWKGSSISKSLMGTRESNRRAFAEGFYGRNDLPREVEDWIARKINKFPGLTSPKEWKQT